MPWLEKGHETPSENLLFVHIPRCGGTSLMKSHDLPQKATKSAPWYRRFGMRTFFTRYELLEKNNFPVWTELNGACLLVFIAGCLMLRIKGIEYEAVAIAMIAGSIVVSIMLTCIFVAPTICRIRIMRRLFLIFVEYVLCQVMANTEYITGTNRLGYLPHLTARKIVDNDYVTAEQFEEACSFAIVRNPYARMVSIYMYNRIGRCESFSSFVKSWHNRVIKDYRERGEMDEWYTPCHAIPQFEYTHDTNGTSRLVHSIVKQEDLKYLKNVSGINNRSGVGIDISKIKNNAKEDSADEDCTRSMCSGYTSVGSSEESGSEEFEANNFGSSIHGLPNSVLHALLGMPHDNQRKTKRPWYDYYDQETLNLTYKMYHRDFEIFGYDAFLMQRPDLEMPARVVTDASV